MGKLLIKQSGVSWLSLRRLLLQLLAGAVVTCLASCHVTNLSKGATIDPDCFRAVKQRIRNATYNTKVDFYSKHFSGLLVFKAVSDTDSRVVFVTETGFKLFDFEFSPNNFKVQYCLPPLRKKIILNTFKNDLGELVQNDTLYKPHINQKDSVITFTFARGNNRYKNFVLDGRCSQLIDIEKGGKYIKSVSTRISGLRNGNFDAIDIYHHPLKLHISLKQIER